MMVSAQTLEAGVGAGTLGVAADANLSRATHVAYDVQVSGYLELFPDEVNTCRARS